MSLHIFSPRPGLEQREFKRCCLLALKLFDHINDRDKAASVTPAIAFGLSQANSYVFSQAKLLEISPYASTLHSISIPNLFSMNVLYDERGISL